MSYERPLVQTLTNRLQEPRRFVQVIVGPRQTGKTTALRTVLKKLSSPTANVRIESMLVRAESQTTTGRQWLIAQWNEARLRAKAAGDRPFILAIDEIQLIEQWSSVVKALWDADTDAELDLRVVLTGSSALLLQRGLREAMTGRFELHHCQQWDYVECETAFAMNLEEYLYFGGYPGAAELRCEPDRWLAYMQEAIILPSVLRDVVSQQPVTKPALMSSLFTLGCSYSAQEVSLRKLMGQLDDAGNATTIATYLQMLSDAGLLTGIQKYDLAGVRRKASSPRLAVHDTGLMVANQGPTRNLLLQDPVLKGHLVESAIGAYLLRRSRSEHFDVWWWRDKNGLEVDFVLTNGQAITGIEVKSGKVRSLAGLDAFCAATTGVHRIVIGGAQVTVEDFLRGEVPLFL